MITYDYDKQKWVEGREGAAVRLGQLKRELSILRGPRAIEYLAMTDRTPDDLEAAVEVCERAISECLAEAYGRPAEFPGDPAGQEFEPRDHNDADGVQTMGDFQ